MYDRGHRAAVLIACAGAFVAFLDTTIVNIAFPDISASFAGSGRDALSWVLDGYFVVIAALLVPAGGLADRFGHKRVFLLGVAGFTGASLLCAAAPSLTLLIAFRVLQGIGAALIAPTSLAIVLDSFPVERRAAGVGLWGAAAAAAAAIGPDPRRGAGRGRRLAARLPRQPAARSGDPARRPQPAAESRDDRDSRLPDLPGAAMLALGLALVTLGIVEGNDWGWTVDRHPRCVRGRRGAARPASSLRSRSHPRPIVEPELFAHRSFRIGNLGTLLFAAAFFSLILGNVLFLTGDLGLHDPPGRRARRCPGPTASDDLRRPGRQARRPLRPPRRDRPRHDLSSPRGCWSCARPAPSPTGSGSGCRARC